MNASEMCTCPTKKQTTANVDVDVRAKQIESPKAAQTNSSFTKNIASNICSTFAAFSINILVFFFNLTVFLKKWTISGSFSSLQTNISILTTNKCEKCPSSTVQCWYLNPRRVEHESPPIYSRPGLPARWSSV